MSKCHNKAYSQPRNHDCLLWMEGHRNGPRLHYFNHTTAGPGRSGIPRLDQGTNHNTVRSKPSNFIQKFHIPSRILPPPRTTERRHITGFARRLLATRTIDMFDSRSILSSNVIIPKNTTSKREADRKIQHGPSQEKNASTQQGR